MSKENKPTRRESGDSQAIRPEQLERSLRIQRLVDQLQELAGGRMIMGHSESCPPELLEAFLEEVLEFEREAARRKQF